MDKIYEVILEEEDGAQYEEVDLNVNGEVWHLSVSHGRWTHEQ